MGQFLQSLGEKAFRYKSWVIIGWIIILGVLGIILSQVGFKTTSSISIPGTQAQKTLSRFEELFPSVGAQSSKIVIEAPQGKTLTDFQSDITRLTDQVAQVDGVTAAVSPFTNPGALSENKTIGFITVQIKGESGSSEVKPATIDGVTKLVDGAQKGGLTIAAGGDLVSRAPGEILGVGEIAGVVIALIVLLITLGSLVAAGMPIVTALVAVGASMAGLFALSKTIDLTNTAPVLAVMLGLAVGIDYSLFIINRYRTLVKEGYDLKTAAGRAIATAGNAVLFAASTVVIALAALAVVQIPFMTVMGLAAAATVAVAALVAITLIPALLSVVGMYIFGRKDRRVIRELQASGKILAEHLDTKTIWYRWGQHLVKFRKTILVSALVVLAVMALPMTGLRLGLPTDEVAAPGTSERQAYDMLAKGFGPGYNGQLLVLVEGLRAPTDADKQAVREKILEQYKAQSVAQAQQLASLPPAAQMAAQQKAQAELQKQVETYAPYYQLQLVADRIAKVEGVQQAQAALTADNGMKGVIQVTPKTGPSEEATKSLVTYLRDAAHQKELTQASGVSLGVTGTTAIQIDINNKLAAALPVYLAVVIGLSLLILMVAFRSVLIPITATLGFLLSVFAMFGAMVAVFQWGWLGITDAPAPIVSFLPIIAIGILFGLAMDYQFFLVSSMQEAYHTVKDAQKAVLRGFALGSRVVVAAGLIMVSVFAGFVSNHDATIQSMGFGLAVGILVDAFIVRMIIIPIVMSYMGKAAWWLPKWLDKLLPSISIEGNIDTPKR